MAEPKRPFWKRKRWIAAAVLWLVIAYPLSAWPIDYLYGRGTITRASRLHSVAMAAYAPLRVVLYGPDGHRDAFLPYLQVNEFFMRLGEEDRSSF